MLVFHHTQDNRVMYMTSLSNDAPPLLSRSECDPFILDQIIRKRILFESLVKTHSLKVSKSDLIIDSSSNVNLPSDHRDTSTPPRYNNNN